MENPRKKSYYLGTTRLIYALQTFATSELYLGEGYMDGKIKIHNGTITEFLEITLKNLGKRHPNNLARW